MRAIKTIEAALEYQHNPDVKRELKATLEQLDADLEYAGYIMDDKMEAALRGLEEAMNTHDDEVAAKRVRARQVAVVDEEDEEEEKEDV